MAAFLYNNEIAKAYQNRVPRQGEIPIPEEAVRCLALFIVPAAWLWQHREEYGGPGQNRIPTCE